MCKRSFHVKGLRNVSYTVGQPMGFLSSWASMAFSHHVLVRWAAILEGKHDFRKYALLGDDIVIWEETVANRYKSLLGRLGVEISAAKSFEEVGLAEFGKAFFNRGRDLRPIPASNLFIQRVGTESLVFEVSKLMTRKGMSLEDLRPVLYPAFPVPLLRPLYQHYQIRSREREHVSINVQEL